MNQTAESKETFLMKPKVDFCFKKLMEDEEVRKGFLAALLGIEPEEILSTELMPTHLGRNYPDDKEGILDVRILLNKKEQVNLEIQLASHKYWRERSLFYLCRMFTEQLHRSDLYEKAQRCIHVSILDFVLFPEDEEYYSRFHLWDDKRRRMYSSKLELHLLELPKLKTGGSEGNPLLRWAQFINSETKEEFEMVTKDDPYLKKAYERLEEVSGDPERRWEYEAREKAIRDYISMMNGSWEDGYESGDKEGYERGKNEMKRQMEQKMEQQKRQMKQRMERQKQVWKLSMEGRLEREIAEQLGISVEEVHKILE